MRVWMVGLLLIAACSHRLIKADDLADIRQVTSGTHAALMTDFNQRIRNLETKADKAETLLRELAQRQKTANGVAKETRTILKRLETGQGRIEGSQQRTEDSQNENRGGE